MKYQVLLKDPPRSTGYFVDIILKIGPTTRLWVKYLLSDPPPPDYLEGPYVTMET